MKRDLSRLSLARALTDCGFERDGADRDPLIYFRTFGDRQVDVQLWRDGGHRASHAVLRELPGTGIIGGSWSTRPTDFRTVGQMHAAILHELARTDHPAEAYGYVPGFGAATLIAAERRRQIDVEGWTSEHDDKHGDGEMGLASACYAMFGSVSDAARDAASLPASLTTIGEKLLGWSAWLEIWPWDRRWWKPKGRRQDLVRAGALIVAEIERLDRKAARS